MEKIVDEIIKDLVENEKKLSNLVDYIRGDNFEALTEKQKVTIRKHAEALNEHSKTLRRVIIDCIPTEEGAEIVE